jgi:hypothetical protein
VQGIASGNIQSAVAQAVSQGDVKFEGKWPSAAWLVPAQRVVANFQCSYSRVVSKMTGGGFS